MIFGLQLFHDHQALNTAKKNLDVTGERTLYRKLQVVVDYAAEERPEGISLAEYILAKKPTHFEHYWRDRSTDKVRHRCSFDSIRNTIELCSSLGFVSSSEALTKLGASASDPTKFPRLISRAVTSLLEREGVPVLNIEEAIVRLLKSGEPPTSKALWTDLAPPQLDETAFARLLTLLGQSKALGMSQRRIFLPRTRQDG